MFSIPQDKGVIQNGDVWVPPTPEKPSLQRPNNGHSEMLNNPILGEEWGDLMGIYEGVLQNDSGNLPTQKFNPKGQGVVSYNQVQHCSSSLPDVGLKTSDEAYSGLSQNFDPIDLIGVKSLEHNTQHVEVSRLQRFHTLDQKMCTSVNNLGEVIPQMVNTLELMKMVTPTKAPLSNVTPNKSTHVTSSAMEPLMNATPNRSNYVTSNAAVVCPHSLAESSLRNCALGGAKLQQNHAFLSNSDVACYNLQEMPNGRRSFPHWQNSNMNFPPTFESGELSSVARPFSLGPATPSQQKQSKNQEMVHVPFPVTGWSSSKEVDSNDTPTQQKQSKNQEMVHVPFPVTEWSSSKEMNGNDNAAFSQQTEILEREQNGSLCNTQDKPIETISTSPAENNLGRGNQSIDLNKTPQQKTPKRRKHRPKVVVEGKPKRTPKPAAAEGNTPDGKPKRKNVRKNGNKTTPPAAEVIKIVDESDAEPARKSCKRALNFDLDNRDEKESPDRESDFQGPNNESGRLSLNLNFPDRESDFQGLNNESGRLSLNLNLISNNAEWPHLSRPATSVVMEGYQNSYSKETQHIPAANSFVHSNEVLPQNSMPQVTMASPPPAPPTPKGRTLNAIARILNAQNTSINQLGGTNNHNHVHQRISGSIAQLVTQANSCEPNFHSRRQLMLQTEPQFQNLVDANGLMGSKREHSHAQQSHIETATFVGYVASKTGQCNNDSNRIQQNALEKGKMKIVEKFNGISDSIPSGIVAIEDSWGQKESARNTNFFPSRGTSLYSSLTNLNGNVQSVSRNSDDKPSTNNGCNAYQEFLHEFQQIYATAPVLPSAGPTVWNTSKQANEPSTNSPSVNCNPDSACPREGKSVPTDGASLDPASIKKRTVGRPRKGDGIIQRPKSKNFKSNELSSKKFKGLQQKMQKTTFSIDDITDCMKELCIYDKGNALVLYKGRDGAVVPYEEFDLVKKKQPRPRVDLDPETNRLWNLLMGKEGSENAEPLDANKQKWWEEERKIFRGRVDSFIARMHLVQGDRRFSKWKGSVVDSVIGVFLTQNVSDHLSSSAFMCLAAKFPIKSATSGSCSGRGHNSSVVHHKVHITFPDGTTCDQEIMKELSYNNASTTYPEFSQHRAENVAEEKETSMINGHARRAEEDIISSQSSSESVLFQASEDIRSNSGSNSEAEDGWNFGRNLGCMNVPLHPEGISALQRHQFHGAGYMQNLGPTNMSNGFSHPIMAKILTHRSSAPQSTNNYWTNMLMGPDEIESLSGWTSTNCEINKGKAKESVHGNIGVAAGIRYTAMHNGRQQFKPPPANHAILNGSHELQTDFPDGSWSRNSQNFSMHGQGNQETLQKDSAFWMDSSSAAQASNGQTNDYSKDAGVALVKTEKEQVNSSRKPSNTVNSTTPNAGKRKAVNGNDEPFDWDTLRKQVHAKSGTRERSRETMDSMDYEALKNADVHEISDTIKERGMNNMLAERIKDFLNRLVRDHGQIDLEWLRDVPPDKAKDYLLSIRGLGLKSVECVRLLTLHHLAFPVDTNVGRIAVRLGWVPLQPLPESLQLHLLELYPVLETIQKYLWPRLCMLDQETLYELHYQMITFGKVFCTKREPNCNACPMRAECRHFASAFASARLALPAPGEKQIVSSAIPISSATPICGTKNPDVVIQPMLLSSIETTIDRGIGLTRTSEPFVEEPSTPEPPTEILEKDIEDAFYEDPDEIPVIKLNVEEFTTNLQSIIQEKMELGEGDMSKALVALSPELASIPVPKLKHVSRLRTEHQVYELPDSHPLLNGMDRREPDDPSPYLLAIWTPGETADSVQPPESTCISQEGGGLCGKGTCSSCSSAKEAQGLTVRGTILIPCRTAMRGSFPLNGTYFQVNEVFADHDSSLNPIDVPRTLIWNLPRRTVFFGTSVSTIFKGLTTEGIQYCFWKGFVCVRGFDQKSRAPRPLKARLHLPASKMTKQNE